MGLFPRTDPFSREVRAESMEEFCCWLAHRFMFSCQPDKDNCLTVILSM